MTVAYSAAQVRAAEQRLIAAGVPLMDRAATALAEEARRHLSPGDAVLLLVGSGDNGGDALFAGAQLAAAGMRVAIVATSSRMHERGLAAAIEAGARVESEGGIDAAVLAGLARDAQVVVDGILGTGSSADAALRGHAKEVVAALLPVLSAPGAARVVAVDLPSGIHPDSGAVTAPTVLTAHTTVTFGGVKRGLLREPARRYVGELVLAEIGLGPELERIAAECEEEVEPEEAASEGASEEPEPGVTASGAVQTADATAATSAGGRGPEPIA